MKNVPKINICKQVGTMFYLLHARKTHFLCQNRKIVKCTIPICAFPFELRYEGKHKEMKMYGRNITSRRNLPFSIGKKIRYNFAYRLLQRRGLEDIISVPKYTIGSIQDQVCLIFFFGLVSGSLIKNI